MCRRTKEIPQGGSQHIASLRSRRLLFSLVCISTVAASAIPPRGCKHTAICRNTLIDEVIGVGVCRVGDKDSRIMMTQNTTTYLFFCGCTESVSRLHRQSCLDGITLSGINAEFLGFNWFCHRTALRSKMFTFFYTGLHESWPV